MELIDREYFIKNMRDWQMQFVDVGHEKEYNLLDMIIRGVENEQIAYDVEKVISEMKSKSRKMDTISVPYKYYRAIGTRVCESIIRRGGVN